MSKKRPNLIEPGMKIYMDYALENSNHYKKEIYNYIFNGTLLFLFIIFLSYFLYYSYNNRISPEEREKEKKIKTQQIIEKVRSLNHQFSLPNSDVFQGEKYFNTNTNTKTTPTTMEDVLKNDPYIITDLPPLKFM